MDLPFGLSPISAKKFSNLYQRLQTLIPRPPYLGHDVQFGFRQRDNIPAHVPYVGVAALPCFTRFTASSCRQPHDKIFPRYTGDAGATCWHPQSQLKSQSRCTLWFKPNRITPTSRPNRLSLRFNSVPLGIPHRTVCIKCNQVFSLPSKVFDAEIITQRPLNCKRYFRELYSWVPWLMLFPRLCFPLIPADSALCSLRLGLWVICEYNVCDGV